MKTALRRKVITFLRRGMFFILPVCLVPMIYLTSCSTGINLKIKKEEVDPLLAGIVREGIYVNTYYRCAFQLPTGWHYIFPEDEADFVSFYSSDKSNQINFKIVDLDEKITLFDFVEKENFLSRELAQIRERQFKIQGLTAIDADFINTVQTENFKYKKIFFLKRFHGFVFTLISKPPVLDRGIARLYALTDSFRFLSQEEEVEDVIESYKKIRSDKSQKQKRKLLQSEKIPADSPYTNHTVKKGETLSLIAEFYTGDTSKHVEIADFNGIEYPYYLAVNDKIKIPNVLLKKPKKPRKPAKTEEKKEEKKEEPIYEPQ